MLSDNRATAPSALPATITHEESEARRKLDALASRFMNLEEASAWLGERKKGFGISRPPQPETLKKAYQQGRLIAVLKSRVLFTNEESLRCFMATYVEHGGRAAAKLKRARAQHQQP